MHKTVITGMAVRTGAARTPAQFETMLRNGDVAIRRLAPGECPNLPSNRLAAPLATPDTHDHRALRGASQSLITSTVVALEALQSAALANPTCGIIIAGSNIAQAATIAAGNRFRTQPAYTPVRHGYEFFDTHLASVIAEIASLQGPGLSIGGASASGNSAVAVAADLIAIGRMDACLVVGPLPDLSAVEWQSLDAMGALLPVEAAACRPLDAHAQGFVPAEACAAITLESLDHARARGAPVLAQIAGSAIVMEPRHGAAPNAEAECRAMTRALENAGIPPKALGYISAHATGTLAGDAAECAAIARLGATAPVNATKSLIGHALQAASLIELVALVLQLQGGFIHGTANLEHPIAPGIVGPGAIERNVEWALNNAFGFGGINTSLVIRNGRAL